MRNLLLSVSFLILSTGVAYAQSQPGNPYAPGSFNNDTQIYQGIISNDADAYLGQLKARQQPQFILPSSGGPTIQDIGQQIIQEMEAKHKAEMRAYDAMNTQRQRALDREMDEIRHQELLNAIERRR